MKRNERKDLMQTGVGIVGITGRMGQVLSEEIMKRKVLKLGNSYSKELAENSSLKDVFRENDVVVDFSNAALVPEVIAAALNDPKPLIICTTGWDQALLMPQIDQLAKKVPVILATNTSIGAAIQRYIVKIVAKSLGEEFDVDLHESHHRFKVDSPSGTATTLLEDIVAAKESAFNKRYRPYQVSDGARGDDKIGVSVTRAGSIVGEHEVIFTSLEEQISIKHTAFDRRLFAKGALKCVEWLSQGQKPGCYTIFDVLNLH